MSQPSRMFVAGDISQTILGAFFLGHPVASCLGMADQRTKLLSKLEQLCSTPKKKIDFAKILASEQVLNLSWIHQV